MSTSQPPGGWQPEGPYVPPPGGPVPQPQAPPTGWQPHAQPQPAGRPPGPPPQGPPVAQPIAQIPQPWPTNVNPDETVQLRFDPQQPLPQRPVQPLPPAPVFGSGQADPLPPPAQHRRPWWQGLPTLIWLAAVGFTIGAMIALS